MIKTIVVPLDGSEYSERALDLAMDLAELSSAKLVLMTVITAYKDAHVPMVPTLEDQARQRAAGYLATFIKRATERGFTVSGEVGHGAPAVEIVRRAKEDSADLIVMSTHGIGASGLHALGSVAMKVLETAPCPVLMVRIQPQV